MNLKAALRSTLDVLGELWLTAGLPSVTGSPPQQFGLPKPLDGEQEAERLLVTSVAKGPSPLLRNKRPTLSSNSNKAHPWRFLILHLGHEGRQCSSTNGLLAVAMGGGAISAWMRHPPRASGRP